LLAEIDWQMPAVFEDDVREAVQAALLDGRRVAGDRRPLDTDEEAQLDDTLARWQRELADRTRRFHGELEALVRRSASLSIWYEENLAF
jgi:hypothetical protein